jgi:hypothetical protein
MSNTNQLNINLTELNDIMDELEDTTSTREKRKNSLTSADVLIIARLIQSMSGKTCTMGLTQDEIGTIKSAIKTMNRGILVIGYAILGAIGAGIVTVVVWAVKHGIIEVANATGKVSK